MRKLLALFVVGVLITSGCSQETIGQSPSSHDLSDPELLAQLGSPLPERVDWRREIEGISVLGVGTRPDPAELDLIGGAIAEVPDALADRAQPRVVVRTGSVSSSDPTHVDARALTVGPDVYLIDRTFFDRDRLPTRLDMARAYLHELAHVAQFMALSDAYIDAALEGRVGRVDPSSGSTLVRDFAVSTGWNDSSTNPLHAEWTLSSTKTAASVYGAADPAEDMAEAVALVAIGRAEWIPSDRTRWVERWLDSGADRLAEGKPWAPVGSTEVLSASPIYDEQEVIRLSTRYAHSEPLYFQAPAASPPHRQLATQIETELGRRRVAGVLQEIEDERVARYAGLFSRPDGVAFWVEMWDFREASAFEGGPEGPVLTYVVLW